MQGMQRIRNSKLSVLVLAAIGVMAQGRVALADDAAPTKLDKIEVTGSMIKRTNAETSEAVTVISVQSLKNMGITSVEQALQQITSHQAQITAATSISSFSGAGSGVSLRGLEPSQTLVLLDGQRLANNVSLGGFVDINVIPFAAIDRIEVLREGASALYGSDAIAGVVNFITRKDYQGGEINLNLSQPEQSGGSGGNLDITYGKGSLAKDGYNFSIAANYIRQNDLRSSQRSFTATPFNPARGVGNSNYPYSFPGAYTDANGNFYQVGLPNCPGNPLLVNVAGTCAYDYYGQTDLIPSETIKSGLVSLSKALGEDHTLSAQYFYTKTKINAYGGPIAYFSVLSPGSDPNYFPTGANSTLLTTGNPAADPGTINATWTDPENQRFSENVNSEQRFLLTFTGDDLGWDYSTSYNYSRNYNTFYTTAGYPNLNTLTNPDGTLSNLINPFGQQTAAGRALLNSAYTNGPLVNGVLSLAGLNGHASHKLGDWLHAGDDVSLALGFDVRHETISYATTPLAVTLQPVTFFPPTAISGARDSNAVFAELNVPVIKQLEFTLSGRHDHYSDFGSTNNGKISFRFQPSDVVTFRGAASNGFRAPTLVDLFSPQVFGATNTILSPACTSGQYNAVFTPNTCGSQGVAVFGGNPNLQAEKSKNYDFGVVLAPIDNLGITIDYYRISLTNRIGSVPATTIFANPGTFASLYHLNSAGSLSTTGTSPVDCVPSFNQPTCGYILQSSSNAGSITTAGFDFSINYLLNTSDGKFKFGFEGTSVNHFTLQQYQGGPYLGLVGGWNSAVGPVIRWQTLSTLDWNQGNWGAGISNNYKSGYLDEFNGSGVNNYSTWNGYGSWKPVKAVTLLAGVRNVLNTAPPFSNQSNNFFIGGFDPILADGLQRVFYAKAKYEF